jgi:hypothetical protein
VQRAKVIVTDAGVKRLTVCESCGEEKYIPEGESVCDECKFTRRQGSGKTQSETLRCFFHLAMHGVGPKTKSVYDVN